MNYRIYAPQAQLAPFIKCYWRLEAAHDNAASRERIFPDGCMELVFHLGDRFRKYTATGDSHIQPRSFIHGQLCRFMEIEATGRIDILAVRFQPHGLKAFLPLPLHEITDLTPTLADCWGNESRNLEEQILTAATDTQRIAIIETFLLNRLRLYAPADNAMHWCVDHILTNGGHTRIDNLANTLNLSKRQLERRFLDTVGIQAKQLSRIARFQTTLRQLEQQSFMHLTAVAHSNGFYDQAHFIRDFQDIAGLSPKQYFASNLELAKYFAEA